MILTAGPSITQKEIEYVKDAVETGWNNQWNNYLVKFEGAFAKFTGAKFAHSTSSCTGAMHLALAACGIKKGDEVIIPDLSWVATASAVKYTGAQPVLADVDRRTWCLDPESVKKAITSKTRAIMPVHLYGHPADMDAINALAKPRGIFVIEDAAQAIGSLYKNRRPGILGDIGCFSFQGAKIMVTGEGGMLVTNNKDLYEKVKFYNNHGRDPKGSFLILELGYKYKMSNIQAALGLAQLERIEELVQKKQLIFSWYEKYLKDVPGIELNPKSKGVVNNYWMSSIVLDKEIKVGRDQLMGILKDKYRIDSRTFYYPVSGFKPFKKRHKNPVSAYLAGQGINLPSGHALTEEEIAYICRSIKESL